MGLTRKKITVRSKQGKTYQRSVMVRAGESIKRTAGAVGRFVNKHKGKIVAGAAVGGLALAATIAHKRSADRVAAAHAHATSEAAARAAQSWASAATAGARVKVDYAREARRKVSEDISRAEQAAGHIRNQLNVLLHGKHDIRDLRRARAEAFDENRKREWRSATVNAQVAWWRAYSAIRSGHVSEGFRPGWQHGRVVIPGKVYEIPTHRLESGLPDQSSQSRPSKPRRSRKKS